MSSKIVKRIRKQMNLWEPQIFGLRALDSTLSAIDLNEPLDMIKASIPGRIDFDTEFPSFCFALATGTGKTRLMGAAMGYLYRKYDYKNFLILTPGRTIYEKIKRELQLSHPKYIFNGLSPFPSPQVLTGEDYYWQTPESDRLTVYLFNIQKIFNPREDVEFRFHRFKEELGTSFADILQELDDLVVLMDESHRYRAPESSRAISSLQPLLGLEYTATPKYQGNIIAEYSLGSAMKDGLIKKVRAVYKENDASYEEELEDLKLQDGARIHLKKKDYIQAYCKNNNLDPIKPVLFINTLSVEKGERLQAKIESDDFMEGQFKDKILFIHYENEDDEEEKLAQLEDPSNPYEVVIHVNMLREGWDVKNIFTLVPLRPSVSMILTAQNIGRGVRLPYGNRRPDIQSGEGFANEAEKETFTLDVICYQPGRDNYKEIIETAKEVLEVELQEAPDEEEEIEQHTITPKDAPNLKIPIRKVASICKGEATLEEFEPTVNREYADVKILLRGIDLSEGEAEELGKAVLSEIENQTKYLIGRLIDMINELSIDDKETVTNIVTKYLEKVPGLKKNQTAWEKFLQKHRQEVYEDIENQIFDHIEEKIKVEHQLTEDTIDFDSYVTVVNSISPKVDKQNFQESKGVKRVIITGYEKSIFPECTFDTTQEKIYADILDRDSSIKRWVRVPKGQFEILTRAGSYSPDFIAEKEDEIVIVEIKEKEKIENENPVVFEKAKEASKWCELVSKQAKKPWKYKLIPHTEVTADRSFDGIQGVPID